MRKFTLGSVAISAGLVLLAGCSGGATAESAAEFPSKAVTVILPYSAGGDTDLNARFVSPYMSKTWGKPVVVSNMTGASGTIASDYVRDSAADGYTVMFNHNNVIINQMLGVTEHSYDAFALGGSVVSDNSTGLVVPADSPYNSLSDLIAGAEEKPGELVYATQAGAFTTLLGYVLEDKANIDLNIVDVGGAADQINEMLGGRTDVSALPYGLVSDHVKAGNVKVIALFAEERNPVLADIPTVKEEGVDITLTRRYSFFLPKETPEATVEAFTSGVKAASEDPEYVAQVEGMYMTVDYLDPAAATKYYTETAAAYEQYKDLLKN